MAVLIDRGPSVRRTCTLVLLVFLSACQNAANKDTVAPLWPAVSGRQADEMLARSMYGVLYYRTSRCDFVPTSGFDVGLSDPRNAGGGELSWHVTRNGDAFVGYEDSFPDRLFPDDIVHLIFDPSTSEDADAAVESVLFAEPVVKHIMKLGYQPMVHIGPGILRVHDTIAAMSPDSLNGRASTLLLGVAKRFQGFVLVTLCPGKVIDTKFVAGDEATRLILQSN